MAKFTIEELLCGEKYGILGEVVKQVFAHQEEFKKLRCNLESLKLSDKL